MYEILTEGNTEVAERKLGSKLAKIRPWSVLDQQNGRWRCRHLKERNLKTLQRPYFHTYVDLDDDIEPISSVAGLGMATMDIIR